MRKLLLSSSALLLLAGGTAFAQSTTIPAPSDPATAPGMTRPDTTTTVPRSVDTKSTTATTTGNGRMWYSHVPEEMRASKLIGTKVRNAAGEAIGDVNELILDSKGKVSAVVIGVGGFLGMGEREVAVSFDQVKMVDDRGTSVLTINATKDSLKTAPAWVWTKM